MSNDDQSKINSFPFYHDHDHDHTNMLSDQGFAFPIVNNFNPFNMYNHPQQNPTHPSCFSFLQEYNTSSAGTDEKTNSNIDDDHVMDLAGTSTTLSGGRPDNMSISSQEAGIEEDSSKTIKDVVRCDEQGDGKSKNVKAKEKGEKKQKQTRIAFMTKSEVDNLEDGYRWRKYGQKAVKNSPFPRSYYRCTSQKCSVKKRIERSYQDPSVVITTYEGQHNHHSPAAMLAPPPAIFPQDHMMFFPSPTNYSSTTNPYPQLITDSHHRQPPPEIIDQYAFLMPASSFLHKPDP